MSPFPSSHPQSVQVALAPLPPECMAPGRAGIAIAAQARGPSGWLDASAPHPSADAAVNAVAHSVANAATGPAAIAARREGSLAAQGARIYARALSCGANAVAGVEALQRLSGALPVPKAGLAVGLYTAPAYTVDVPALPVSRLTICLTAGAAEGALQGHPRRTHASRRYALFLTPAGSAAHWRKPSPSRHLSLYFGADALADCGLPHDARALGDEPLLNQQVPGLRGLIDELTAEMQADSACAAEATDSLARLLLIRLARHRLRAQEPAAGRNPLSPQSMQRLVDHVQAHLADRILVSDLAAVAGLSPNRFAHACTRFVGQSPHQFVMALRLRQAMAMLREGSAPLAEVAAACGFASQQHLTQVMRKRLGITPARYRCEPVVRPPDRSAGPAGAQIAGRL